MTDVRTTLGPLRIPLPSEGPFTPISDAVISGFLDYFGFWIRTCLMDKISDPNDTQPDPLPPENVFDYDPMGNWVRTVDSADEMRLPALYMWQSGPSRIQQWSITSDMRIRSFKVMYVCKPIFAPEGSKMFSGLGAAVDGILTRAWSKGSHPLYSYSLYGTEPSTPGTPIQKTLKLFGWKYDGGQPGMIAPVPGTSPRVGGPGDGMLVEYFPALLGAMTVWERIEEDTFSSADQATEIAVSLNVNDPADVRGPLTVMDGFLVGPSETPDNGD